MAQTPLLLRRRDAYRRTFLDADGRPNRNAERVLADLRRFCRATAPSFTPGDPYTTALLEGRREVWNRLMAFLQLDDDRVWHLTEGDDD
jgi:hypothetical protein